MYHHPINFSLRLSKKVRVSHLKDRLIIVAKHLAKVFFFFFFLTHLTSRRNSQHSMDRPETIAVKYEPTTVDSPSSSSAVAVDNKPTRPQKLVVLADLNFNPPESDDLDSSSIQIPTPSTTRYSLSGSSYMLFSKAKPLPFCWFLLKHRILEKTEVSSSFRYDSASRKGKLLTIRV